MTTSSNAVRKAAWLVLLLLASPAHPQQIPTAVVSIRGPVRMVQFSRPPHSDVWLYALSDMMNLHPGDCVRVVGDGGEAVVRLRTGTVQRLRAGQGYCIPTRLPRAPSASERVRSAFSGTFETVVALLSGPRPPAWAVPLEGRDSTRAQWYPILLLPDTLFWASLNARPTVVWLTSDLSDMPAYEVTVFPADERCDRAGEAVARGRSSGQTFTLPQALSRGAAFRVELARPVGPVLEHGCLRISREEEAPSPEEGVRAIREHFAAEGGADPAEEIFVAAQLVDAGMQVDAVSLLHASARRDARGGGARALTALLARYVEHLKPHAAGGG